MRTSESVTALIEALCAARGDFKPVVREATGQVGGNRTYKYAPLETVIDACAPSLAKRGLVLIQAVDAETSTLVTRLAHKTGEWVECAYPLHAFERPQDYGSQLTYARRYSQLALLNLAQEDDDGQAAQVAPAPAKAAPSKPAPEKRRAPVAEIQTIETVVRKVEVATGASASGPWTRYRVFLDALDEHATTFSTRIGADAIAAQEAGIRVLADLQPTPKGLQLCQIRECVQEASDDEPF